MVLCDVQKVLYLRAKAIRFKYSWHKFDRTMDLPRNKTSRPMKIIGGFMNATSKCVKIYHHHTTPRHTNTSSNSCFKWFSWRSKLTFQNRTSDATLPNGLGTKCDFTKVMSHKRKLRLQMTWNSNRFLNCDKLKCVNHERWVIHSWETGWNCVIIE